MRRRPGLPATNVPTNWPAPMGGLNTVSPAAAMPPQDALQLFNLTPAENGLRSRLGSREWVTGLAGALDSEVRSVLPFTGAAANGAGDRLFATTSTGIWDASASTGTPTQVLAFGITTGQAGHGISHVAVTAGGHFLLYCDEENGLHIYSESSAAWLKATQAPPLPAIPAFGEIQGANPDNFVFCTVWKHRAFYVEKSTARAWYTGVGAITGGVSEFDFAQRFRAGGPLVGLWNWTYDGGAGIDDSLVAVSGGGDVAIYQGTNIATDAQLKGVWTLGGAPPAGRRIATDWGGELLLLSRLGVLPISQLVTGGEGAARYTTAKVANLFNSLMLTRAGLLGWSLRIHPEDNCLVVTIPTVPGLPTEQLVLAQAARAWSRYRDLPILSSEVWGGKLYFGTNDGRVMVNDGYIDGVLLANPNAYTPVQWAVLTSFQSMGNGRYKHVELLRPTFQGPGVISAYDVAARYRYNQDELPPVAGAPSGTGTWDDASWDSSLWGGDYVPTQAVRGATGLGVEVAIAMRGQAVARTIILGWDVLYSQGGWL